MAEDFTVEYGGETFEIGEPNADIVLRILNCLGKIGMRGEGAAVRVMRKPTTLATLFGLMAVLNQTDIVDLGSAVLQFGEKAEGKRFMKEHEVRVAPIIKALFFNLQQSEDLVEAISAFFDGIEGLSQLIERVVPSGLAPEVKTEAEDKESSVGS